MKLNDMSKHEGYTQINEVEAVRKLDTAGIMIDVAKRDTEEGRHHYNVIVYLKDKRLKEHVGAALGRTWAAIFGDMNPEHFDFAYQDQAQIKRRLGAPLNNFDNFFLEIKWPRSAVHSVQQLKTLILPRLIAEMEKV